MPHSPAYAFVEFPKWVTRANGAPTIVHNADHEASVMAPDVTVEENALRVQVEREKDALRVEASRRRIKVDNRWSVDRLKSEIARAKPLEIIL